MTEMFFYNVGSVMQKDLVCIIKLKVTFGDVLSSGNSCWS